MDYRVTSSQYMHNASLQLSIACVEYTVDAGTYRIRLTGDSTMGNQGNVSIKVVDHVRRKKKLKIRDKTRNGSRRSGVRSKSTASRTRDSRSDSGASSQSGSEDFAVDDMRCVCDKERILIKGKYQEKASVRLPRISTGDGHRAASLSDTNLQKSSDGLVPTLSHTAKLEISKKRKGSVAERRVPILVAIKPENQESEKERFMRSNYHVSPQFVYKHPIHAPTMERLSQPSNFLLPLAIKIMRHALVKHGSYERFEESSGGRKLSRIQILDYVRNYLKQENMENEVQVKVCEDLLSRGCMTRMRGQPTVLVRAHNIRENWIEGLLRHEIGTHYLRSCNNRQQVWANWKKRSELNLRPINPTEEGLASLHSIILRPLPILWKNALLYYATCKAFEMSFSQLFKDMGQFVKDPNIRWEYCLRAKRGHKDTSVPGAFCKDQVYLKGALEILKHRHKIDFHLLVRCGKVCHRDLDKLRNLAILENTRIPEFMKDSTAYRKGLDHIMASNGLTDEDLAML